MTREDFIKAIYEGYNCDGFCEDVGMSCRECVEKKFAEYEKQIRADAIEELLNNVSESIIWDILAEIMKRNISASEGTDKVIEHLKKVAERLKENDND